MIKQDYNATGHFNNDNAKIHSNEPVFVMTIELEQGTTASINIFPNTDPEETAYEFCKINNLEFNALGYLTTEIKNLIASLTPSKLLCNLRIL